MDRPPSDGPTSLGFLLDQVIRRRGIAEKSAQQELNRMWADLTEPRIRERSFVRRLRDGVLEIGVRNGAVLEELNGFRRHELLEEIQARYAEFRIRTLKFIRVR